MGEEFVGVDCHSRKMLCTGKVLLSLNCMQALLVLEVLLVLLDKL